MVATDRSVRADRGRGRRRLRRVGRGRPPAHHAARVHRSRHRPGRPKPRLCSRTYYTPATRAEPRRRPSAAGSTSTASARLAARNLPRDPVTLGPAQMSRLVFATPRVRNLLGLRNLEIRDLDKSSLDAVLLGRAAPVVPPGRGRPDPEPLRGFARTRRRAPARGDRVPERSGGPRAGHRQRSPAGAEQAAADRRPASRRTRSSSEAGRARVPGRERAAGGRDDHVRRPAARRKQLELATGRERVRWVPSAAGDARVRVEVAGLDGTARRGQRDVPRAERATHHSTDRRADARRRRSTGAGLVQGHERRRRVGHGLDPLRHRVLAALPDPRRHRRRRVDSEGAGPGGAPDSRPRTPGPDREREAAHHGGAPPRAAARRRP